MSKVIIGIVGEIASGKTTITEYLKSNYGAVSFRFSNILRDILERLHLPQDRKNLQTLSSALRQSFSEDILSRVLSEDAQSADNPIVITEGIRRPSDIVYLKNLPGFILIAVEASERTRFERLTGRSENPDDQQKTWEQFQDDGKAEAEQDIKEIAKSAQYTVDNNGDMESTYAQIEKIMQQLGLV